MKKRDHWQYFVKAYLVGVDRKCKKTYTNWDLVSSSYDGIIVEIKECVEWIKKYTKHNKTIEISDVYVRLNEDQINDIRHLTGVNPIKKKNVKKKIITNEI